MDISFDLSYYENDGDFMYDMIKKEPIVKKETYKLLEDLEIDVDEYIKEYLRNGESLDFVSEGKVIDGMIDAIIENGLVSEFTDIIEDNYDKFDKDTILYILNVILHDSARNNIVNIY